MQHFYGRDDATYSGTAPSGVTRQFTSFSQLREDIVDARVSRNAQTGASGTTFG
jgi:hypothetical protein